MAQEKVLEMLWLFLELDPLCHVKQGFRAAVTEGAEPDDWRARGNFASNGAVGRALGTGGRRPDCQMEIACHF